MNKCLAKKYPSEILIWNATTHCSSWQQCSGFIAWSQYFHINAKNCAKATDDSQSMQSTTKTKWGLDKCYRAPVKLYNAICTNYWQQHKSSRQAPLVTYITQSQNEMMGWKTGWQVCQKDPWACSSLRHISLRARKQATIYIRHLAEVTHETIHL